MHKHDDKYPNDRDSSLVPPDYKPQSIRMSYRGVANKLVLTPRTLMSTIMIF